MWQRVFATRPTGPLPGDLLAHLHASGHATTGRFHGDDAGWFRAELVHEATGQAYELQRYLATEPGIRDELNAWAAWVELCDTPFQSALMQHLVTTQQIYTLKATGGVPDLAYTEALLRWLTACTGGIWQRDGVGFLRDDGTLMLAEEG
jgi:hypothetical protein